MVLDRREEIIGPKEAGIIHVSCLQPQIWIAATAVYKDCLRDSGKHIEGRFATSSDGGLAGTMLCHKPNHVCYANLHLLFSRRLFVSSVITRTWRVHLCLQKEGKIKELDEYREKGLLKRFLLTPERHGSSRKESCYFWVAEFY